MPSLRSELLAIYDAKGDADCMCGFCSLARREIAKRDKVISARRAYHQQYYAEHREEYRMTARERYKRNAPRLRKQALQRYYANKAKRGNAHA